MYEILIRTTTILAIINFGLIVLSLLYFDNHKKFWFILGTSSLITAITYALQIPFSHHYWFAPYGTVIWLFIGILFLKIRPARLKSKAKKKEEKNEK